MKPQIILFDLDGTLLDTAPDLAYALNQVRQKHQLPELPFTIIRPVVSHGMRALLKLGLDIDENHENFNTMLEECLSVYQMHATNATRLFPGMEIVLQHLDDQRVPWGIVTNKPSRFTFDILKNLDLETRAACVVCGDTLAKSKPDPEPILHACQLLQRQARDCVFVGDSSVDVKASKAAGTTSLVALYGYIGANEDPFDWKADGYVREPIEIIDWLAGS